MCSLHSSVTVQVLHQSRLKAGPAKEPAAAAFLDKLRRERQLYSAPFGSNDDWYWLYAAVQAGRAPDPYLRPRQIACPSSAETLACLTMADDPCAKEATMPQTCKSRSPTCAISIMAVSASMFFMCARIEAKQLSDLTGPTALIASCDEMRDHVFQLLRPKYFRKWKQRHQVYYKYVPVACC